MAYFDSSVLLEARIKALEAAEQKFNKRPIKSDIHDVYLAGQEYVKGVNGESIEDLKKSVQQPTKILYHKNTTFTDTTVKTCSPNGDVGGSGETTLTWAKFVNTVKIPQKMFTNNEYGAAEMFLKEFKKLDEHMVYNRLNTVMLAHLEANRTQVNALSAGGGVNTWVGAPDFNTVTTNANKGRFYNLLTSDMMRNGYDGEMFDIFDLNWWADYSYYLNQGTANSVNTAFQYPNILPIGSKLITPAAGNQSTHYVVPVGAVASLFWNEAENKNGVANRSGEWDTFESMIIPGLFYDVFIKDGCADTTSYGGSTQSPVIDYEFTMNYSLFKQPIDVANETPIFKNVVTTL